MNSKDALFKEAQNKLIAIREVKKNAISRYFKTIESQSLSLAHSVMVQEAATDFINSFRRIVSDNKVGTVDINFYKEQLFKFYSQEFLEKFKLENEGKEVDIKSFIEKLTPAQITAQYFYIIENQNKLGEKHLMMRASDESTYSNNHERYHNSFKDFLEKFGYYDVFIVDAKSGEVVYSVFKELDYATSLINGPYQDSSIARAFRSALLINDIEKSHLEDFDQYVPSYNSPASFIATPVWNKNGEKIAVLIFQMPIDRINLIMKEKTGMGETGETFLFGSDRRMRSDSFFVDDYSIVNSFKKDKRLADADSSTSESSVSLAMKGEDGSGIFNNYRGVEVISSFGPIDILGLRWGIIGQIEVAEALQSSYLLRNISLVIVLIAACLILFVAWLVARQISSGVLEVASKLKLDAEGLANSSQIINESSSQLSEAATEQASSLQETVSSIDEISAMVQRNADSANTSKQISSKSSEAAQKGKKTVDQMMKAINEISNSNEKIMSEMKESNEEISHIVTLINQISEKTKVINDIVFQTKLLSFNASVEAARAGEHGRGFAVVAEEVGNLASMSGKAALEISEMLDKSTKQVNDIVESSKSKVENSVKTGKEKVDHGIKTAQECGESLDEILLNVSTVNEMVAEIANASNEQAVGVREVTKAMQQLDQVTHQNTTVAQQSSVLAQKIKMQSEEVQSAVAILLGIIHGSAENHDKIQGLTKLKKSSSSDSNVISFQKKNKFSESLITKKASGDDLSEVNVPKSDDPRFEDV